MLTPNQLFYGDNLEIMRDHIPDASVDLVYLDPPFNSKRDYNVLFKEESGEASPAQMEAFTDTWRWDQSAAQTYAGLVQRGGAVGQMIGALYGFIGNNAMMAYLAMMAARLVELHRVLKPTGSLYLHCDPTASHYLKVVLDTIFGKEQFRSEIIWKRTTAHSSAKRYGPVHDVILYYSSTDHYTWNAQFMQLDEAYTATKYRHRDPNGRIYRLDNLTGAGTRQGSSGQPWRGFDPAKKGRHWVTTLERLDDLLEEGRIYMTPNGGVPQYKRYLDEIQGRSLQDVWEDIDPINSQAQERLGYPTQKPLALLERIISASSNPGDVVLDPFCGCGTAVVAAQKLGRQWIGIDVTYLSITLMRKRIKDSFGDIDYEVVGEPADMGSARALFQADAYQFQWWALGLVEDAVPAGGEKKKGADKGIDGSVSFLDDATGKPKRCIIQVKGGHVSSAVMRDLVGTISRENAEMGLLITLEPPTGPMRQEAASSGFYHSPHWNRDYPRIQIATIEDLMNGRAPAIPHGAIGLQRAARVRKAGAQQPGLGLD